MKNINFNCLYGNDTLKSYLSRCISEGELFHSIVLVGKTGTGKKTLARHIISAIACQSENAPCGECGACEKILSDECVDIHIIKRPDGKSFVPIDSVRAIYDTVSYKPNDLDFKVYMIQEGDRLLPQAQNALLKLLEEPPQNVYFFILCEDERKLLPTIRSRCEILKLQEFSCNELERYLNENFSSGDTSTAARLAKGSLGTAVKMLDGNDPALHHRAIADTLSELLLDRGANEFDFITYQQDNIKSLNDLFEIYKLLLSALRDIIAIKEAEDVELVYYENIEKPDEYACSYSSLTLASMCGIILQALSNDGVNTRLPLTITELSSRLWHTKFNGEK